MSRLLTRSLTRTRSATASAAQHTAATAALMPSPSTPTALHRVATTTNAVTPHAMASGVAAASPSTMARSAAVAMASTRPFTTSSLCAAADAGGAKNAPSPLPGKLRGVIFDVGGVLLPSPFPAIARLEKKLQLPAGSISTAIVLSGDQGAFAKLERGEFCTDEPAFWAQFKAEYERHNPDVGGAVDGRQFLEAIVESSSPAFLPAGVDALQCLRAEGVRTAALTNDFKTSDGETGLSFPEHLFDVVVESAKDGVRKPDPKAFELVLSRLQLAPEEVVFLDDIGRNCQAASELGIHAIKVSKLRTALAALSNIAGFPMTGFVAGTKAAIGKHELPVEPLTQVLRKSLPTISQHVPLNIRKYAHGQSNPTYFVGAGAKKFVLRKKPPGKLLPSAHAIDREYRVTEALYKFGVPVAKPLFYCEDDSVIGTPFYIMKHVSGRLLKEPKLPKQEPTERQAIYRSMCEALGKLHNVIPADAGLSSYGKEGQYLERQVKRWSSQYRSSETHTIGSMDELIGWLPENMPKVEVPSRIVHGDFRLDNLILEEDSPAVVAILDWELSTLGDPFSDLAYHCMPYHVDSNIPMLGGLGGLDLASLGIPSEAEYIRWYCEFRNLPHDMVPDWNFYLAFSFFRIAAIIQGVYKRALSGQGSSDNGKMTGMLVEYFAQRGLDLRHGNTATSKL